ncbi:protein translocase subunit SecF [Photobacterium kishitanii]|uniref:Protein translocase subunit SecF n=1 Tax=Photobacterium kishitanii TaxID=318456 RepID=A0A2T3KMP3_9GAMM|nr:protein translocase subunit SecF [Photobacterium kishitanii]PSV01070.1 hypothetical protein C9J27_03365 [Photobacterium kishitanii]
MNLFTNKKSRNAIASTSILLCLIGLIFVMFNKPVMGIEFTGGTVYTVKSDLAKVTAIVGNDSAFKLSKDGSYTIVKTSLKSGTEHPALEKIKAMASTSEHIGPSLGSELIHDSIVGLALSFLLIAIYLAIRYNLMMALSALLALAHDVLLTIVILALFKVEISSIVVGAVLTVVGYSINDSVVTLDKLREVIRDKVDDPIQSAIEITLTRNIRTCVATMLVIISMYLFGGDMVHDFSFTMLCGVTFGMISSITVMPLLLAISSRRFDSLSTTQAPSVEGNI